MTARREPMPSRRPRGMGSTYSDGGFQREMPWSDDTRLRSIHDSGGVELRRKDDSSLRVGTSSILIGERSVEQTETPYDIKRGNAARNEGCLARVVALIKQRAKKRPLAGPKRKGADCLRFASRFREHPLCDATWLVAKADSKSGTCRRSLARAVSSFRQVPHFQRESAKSRALDSDGSLEPRHSSRPFPANGCSNGHANLIRAPLFFILDRLR
jgi:hypothetical protein